MLFVVRLDLASILHWIWRLHPCEMLYCVFGYRIPTFRGNTLSLLSRAECPRRIIYWRSPISHKIWILICSCWRNFLDLKPAKTGYADWSSCRSRSNPIYFFCLLFSHFPCEWEYGRLIYSPPIPVAMSVYDVGLQPLCCRDCGFESCRGHGYLLYLLIVV